MKNHLNAIFLFILYFSPSYTESKSRQNVNCGPLPSEQVYFDHQPTERHVYIVYLGEHSGKKTFHEIEHDHHAYLHSVKGSIDEVKASIIYSYKNVVNGFSALLTQDEAAILSDMEEVLSVFKSNSREYGLHTTRSWEFVNVLERVGNSDSSHSSYEEDLMRKANNGQNIIVGVMDSGVWPESKSFSDEGMEPIPESWKGTCQQGVAFNSSHCNRKLIGARYYLKSFEQRYGPLDNSVEYHSPRDRNGHGTHTASTIGGRRVANTSISGGFANGTAVGGAPLVRLAIYKVCWVRNITRVTCRDDDVLAGFDDAISDGVNVISASLGALRNISFINDGISIGAWHAERRNIVVVCSAGNDGPAPSTVTNVAPWILTVGASSIDRIFSSPILLGNGTRIQGQTITQLKLQNMHSLVYAGDVEVPTTNLTRGLCLPNTLIPELVRGKVVFCWRGAAAQAFEVRRAGGVGAILGYPQSAGQGIQVQNFVLPATVVFANDTNQIISYIRSSENPMVTLTPATTLLDTKPAPFMAPFSSTGPNSIQPNILKPDITAPGLNILAAWTEGTSLTSLPNDTRVMKYNIVSGTSMSCPHVAAVAALLKAIHPDWSSASIRSALMTTATVNDNTWSPITDHNGNPATPFNYGAGHFQPRRAVDPGLVYNTTERDYNLYLCKTEIDFLDPLVECPENLPPLSNLNYPSLAIPDLNGTMTVERSVTNVGTSNSTYTSTIIAPDGYSVEISPRTLQFRTLGETKSFNITVISRMNTRDGYAFGWYMWSDGIHVARSPIAVSSLTLLSHNELFIDEAEDAHEAQIFEVKKMLQEKMGTEDESYKAVH